MVYISDVTPLNPKQGISDSMTEQGISNNTADRELITRSISLLKVMKVGDQTMTCRVTNVIDIADSEPKPILNHSCNDGHQYSGKGEFSILKFTETRSNIMITLVGKWVFVSCVYLDNGPTLRFISAN